MNNWWFMILLGVFPVPIYIYISPTNHHVCWLKPVLLIEGHWQHDGCTWYLFECLSLLYIISSIQDCTCVYHISYIIHLAIIHLAIIYLAIIYLAIIYLAIYIYGIHHVTLLTCEILPWRGGLHTDLPRWVHEGWGCHWTHPRYGECCWKMLALSGLSENIQRHGKMEHDPLELGVRSTAFDCWSQNPSFDRLFKSTLSGKIWVWVNTYRYIFSGMNIHKSQLFWGSRHGTRVLTHPHITWPGSFI